MQGQRGEVGDLVDFGPYAKNSSDAFDFVRHNTNDDDVIAFFKPRVLSYLTDRRSLLELDFEGLVSGRSDYVLMFESSLPNYDKEDFMLDIMDKNSDRLSVGYENPEFTLYHVQRPVAP